MDFNSHQIRLEKERKLLEDKRSVNIVVLGHVDSGKSTIIGNLIHKSNDIPKRVFEKIEKECADIGKSTFKYAWIADRLGCERERGLTIHATNTKFIRPNHYFTLINVPGHRDYTRSTIIGLTHGDYGLLVVAAPKGEFEPGFNECQHPLLAYTLGIRKLIVVVNKMDELSVNYSEERFNFIVNEMSGLLKKIGFSRESLEFIPISGWLGDNLIDKKLNNKNLSWYKGGTLVDLLDTLKIPIRVADKPLRLPLAGIYKIGGIGTVPRGKVEYGKIRPGEEVVFSPQFICTEVKSIEKHLIQQGVSESGDIIGFNVMNVALRDIHRGDVVGYTRDNPPSRSESFIAQIIVLKHPRSTHQIKKGYSPILNCHTVQVGCRITDILEKIDKSTNKPIPKEIDKENEEITLQQGDSAIVNIKPFKPISVETHSEFPALGRFILRDNNMIVAVGIIKSVDQIKFTRTY